MATVTAQNILDENSWTSSDISVANLEKLIDNAINYINLETGLTMSNLSGSPGSTTVTSGQSTIIKALTVLMVEAYLHESRDEETQVALGGISVVRVLNDPRNRLFSKLVEDGINRLRGRSFLRT